MAVSSKITLKVNKTPPPKIFVGELNVGAVFTLDKEEEGVAPVYMKTDETGGPTWRCMELRTGKLVFLRRDDVVGTVFPKVQITVGE